MAAETGTIERRQQLRLPCTPPIPVSFVSSGGKLNASVVDISVGGAQMRIPLQGDRTPFLIQGEFDYTLQTDVGPAWCRARTKWIQRVHDEFLWGVEYVSLAEKSDDPLRLTIDALRGNAG